MGFNLAEILNSVNAAATTFRGSSTTTSGVGSTSTVQSGITNEGIQTLIRQILESDRGLAATASAQKGAGLYNSSTNRLLLNDLTARASGEVAKLSAPTVTTSSPTQSTVAVAPKIPVSALKTGGLGSIGALGAKIAADKLGVTKKVKDAITGIGSTSTVATAAYGVGSPDFGSSLDSFGGSAQLGSIGEQALASTNSLVDQFSMGFTDGGSVVDSGVLDFVSGGIADAASSYDYVNGADLSSDLFASGADAIGGATDAFSAAAVNGLDFASDTASAAADGSALAFDAGGFPVVSTVTKLASGDAKGAATNAAVYFAANAILPGSGAVAALATNLLGKDNCYITTAVCQQNNLADDCELLTKLRAFRDTWLKENHPLDIVEYYNEAPKIVRAIEAEYSEQVRVNIYDDFLNQFIIPAVKAIDEGNNIAAYDIYKLLYKVARQYAKLKETSDA